MIEAGREELMRLEGDSNQDEEEKRRDCSKKML